MIRELTAADMEHLKKVLSLLSEEEEEEGAKVSVEADALRALIGAYELVGKQWRDLIKDYERREHQNERLQKQRAQKSRAKDRGKP